MKLYVWLVRGDYCYEYFCFCLAESLEEARRKLTLGPDEPYQVHDFTEDPVGSLPYGSF